MNHIAIPTERLVTTQRDSWLCGRESEFVYDLTRRAGMNAELETDDVIEELLGGDVYDLRMFTEEGDVWVDAGCHVGLFSIAAMMAGADVSVMFDVDPALAFCAEANARSFLTQQLIRSDYTRERIRPTGYAEEIRGPGLLVGAGMQTREVWEKHIKRSCLKMDIQGSEEATLLLGGSRELAAAFDAMVLEWHYEDLDYLYSLLTQGGWKVTGSDPHCDVLTSIDTQIVWAVSG